MLIGLSLSFCVSDIINGLVDKDDVIFIISGTRIMCKHDLENVLSTYAKYHWGVNPELGMSIAREFYNRGVILQPRALGHSCPHISEGYWAKVYGRDE